MENKISLAWQHLAFFKAFYGIEIAVFPRSVAVLQIVMTILSQTKDQGRKVKAHGNN